MQVSWLYVKESSESPGEAAVSGLFRILPEFADTDIFRQIYNTAGYGCTFNFQLSTFQLFTLDFSLSYNIRNSGKTHYPACAGCKKPLRLIFALLANFHGVMRFFRVPKYFFHKNFEALAQSRKHFLKTHGKT